MDGLGCGPKIAHFLHLAHSLNRSSDNVFVVLFMFADHENIGNKQKNMILLCTVQKLWLIAYGYTTISGYNANSCNF